MELPHGEDMDSRKRPAKVLADPKIPIKMKLSALWVSVMFCYIYGDYFGLYQPGALKGILAGRMGPLGPTTQAVLLGTATLMAIPSVMVFLSLVLKPNPNRWLNIILGAAYTVIILITMPGDWAFYIFLGVIEVALTGSIVWYAWKWPAQDESNESGRLCKESEGA
jgi:hypothetical protein